MADLLRVLVRLFVGVLVVIAAIAVFAVIVLVALIIEFCEDLQRLVTPIHPKGERPSAQIVPFAKKNPEGDTLRGSKGRIMNETPRL